MTEQKQRQKKASAAPRHVYELTVEVDGEVVFDSAVEARRPSELSGIANDHARIGVGQVLKWRAERIL